MPLSFALSISHFVSSVGADAGFAALIGLAILVLLYFAHAREASSLRDELTASQQRIDALERRHISVPLPTPAPVPKPTIPTPAGPARAPSRFPAPATASAAAPVAAPAGVGAPALIDATRVVPAFEQVAPAEVGDEVDGREQEIPAAALSAPGGTGVASPPRTPARPAVGRTPAPVTAAAGGNGSAPPRAGEPVLPGSLLREGIPGRRRRRPARWLVPAAVAAAAVAAVVIVLVVVTGGGSGTPRAHTVTHHSTASQMARALHAVSPGAVTVAVLNGTTVNQLAHRTSQRLTSQGFKAGPLATASNQFVHKTSVGYLPGHRLDALVVAHALKLTSAAVAPVQAAARALGCPGSSPCSSQVIVTVGTDLANAP